ncbi:MAG: methylcobamide--CoM methyltransferase [Actinomycetota bacterium]
MPRGKEAQLSITTTVVGSYPKPPDEGRTFTLRKTLHAVERGDATAEDIKTAQDALAREVIAEQETAGIDVITDGQVRWDDIVTPFARHMAGFTIGGLLRFFDNNTYYRRPICTGPIEWRGPSTVEGFKFAKSVAAHEVKAIIPGPVTFARLSVDEHYHDYEEFVLSIARVLAQEAFELEAAGATTIQIDEPALLNAPEDLQLADTALNIIIESLERSETSTTLATYFGDAKRLGPELFSFPVDCFAFDLVSGSENVRLIEDVPPEKNIQAGIIDARNTRLEAVPQVIQTIERLVDIVGPGRLTVSPSAGLEYLPREKARAKLHLLHEATERVDA